MAKEGTFSWLFIIALVFVSFWVISKLRGNNGQAFSGVSNQRGLFGTDQFGTMSDVADYSAGSGGGTLSA
jgi:hypothetical protein